MVTEKTAQKREAAVLQATKPCFEKVSRGLEYLEQLTKTQIELSKKNQKAWDEKFEIEREISFAEQKKNHLEISKLQKKLREIENKLKSISNETERMFGQMISKCENCGAFMSPIQIVCHKCGAISKAFPYDIENVTEIGNMSYENGISQLSSKMQNYETAYTLYPELKKEIDAISKIKTIAKTYLDNNISEDLKKRFQKIYTLADKFLADSQDEKIEIAIVGNVKSGKSTLINALLGARMASVNCTPETAVLVKYHTTADKNYIKASFYTNKQWKKIWEKVKENKDFIDNYKKHKADDIKEDYIGKSEKYIEFSSIDDLRANILKWTSSSNPEYYFVNELEVGFVGNQLPNDVVLVDTPGLADKVYYRSKITKRYLKNADYVLACVRYETMDSVEEEKFLEEVSTHLQKDVKRMLIIGTQADKMNNLDDVFKKQDKFLKDLLPLFDNKAGLVANHFVRVYAEPQILLHEYLSGIEISEDAEDLLDTALRRIKYRNLSNVEIALKQSEIEEKFGITLLNKKLNEMVFEKTRKQIIQKIKENYISVNRSIRNTAEQSFSTAKNVLLSFNAESNDFYSTKEEIEENISKLTEQKSEIGKLITIISSHIKESEED